MEEPVDEQRLKDYQERVTNWIGRQGLFFQVRYLRLSKMGSIWGRLASLTAVLVVLISIAGALGFGALKIYQRTEGYEEKLGDHMAEVLGAESLESQGFFRSRGNGGFRRIILEGGDGSFYYDGKLVGFEAPFPFYSGILDVWSPSIVQIERADFSLKAGGRQKEMDLAMTSVLESLKGDGVTRIKVQDFSCEWGYSKLTFGGVYNAKFDATLLDGRWEVSLTGGYFRQNWVGPCRLRKASLAVEREGIIVDALVLEAGEGVIQLSGAIRGPAAMPEFDLKGSFSAIPVDQMFEIIGADESKFIEGRVSGVLELSGSTNRRITTRGKVVLAEEDQILIRDRWRLLRAISAVTKDGTYLRVGFDRGSFDFFSEKGGCEVTNIDLRAGGVANLTGQFSTRLPTQKEAADFLGISLTDGFSNSLTDSSAAQRLEDDRLSIRRATKGENEGFGIELELDSDEDFVKGTSRELEQFDGFRLRREMSKHRFFGELQLALPAKAFEKNKRVTALYLSDTDWASIPMKFDSVTFEELSKNAGENLLKEGREYRDERGSSEEEVSGPQ